ncbi:MAG TPA: O-antigen ligase family protein, partial [Thermoanaerobaculia bacterium]|nr:O-antigen ligase family protein [Thermoanaerobaculia bacterium]
MLPLLPAFLALLTGVWCGTFSGGATFLGSSAALLLLLLALLVGGIDGNPLGLRQQGGWLLPLALVGAVAASSWASPVPRAGWPAVILLPGYLALPGALSRCLQPSSRRGVRALSAVVGLVALLSLVAIPWLHAERAAFPLGHHNLLAAWLLLLLPLAFLPAREEGGWRYLGWGSGLLGAAAILASRSLLGGGGLGMEVVAGLALFGWHRQKGGYPSGRKGGRKGAFLLAGGALLALVLAVLPQGARGLRVLAGADPSARARAVYARAGWEGFKVRPLLGWGAGSAAWTAGRFLRPVPGVNPPGEVVGELHSLPLEIAYELGATGVLLSVGLAAAFLARRWRDARQAADPPLAAAGLLGLLGGSVAALGSAALGVTALPIAAAIAAAVTLPVEAPSRSERRSGVSVAGGYALCCLVALTPNLLAFRQYERALSTPGSAHHFLASAVKLDPSFPLYRARLAWLPAAGGSAARLESAEQALTAAREAPGVGAFWLAAGALGLRSQRPWAVGALRQACALDPLSPFAPFLLMLAEPESPEAPTHAAHAFLAEPRLLGSPFWENHPTLLTAALQKLSLWPGIDPG